METEEFCPGRCNSTLCELGYCLSTCFTYCSSICPPPPPPTPPPPPPPNHRISTPLIIIIAILSATLLLAIVKYCSSRNSSRRRPPPQSEDTHEEFLDENHGPIVDHHIWLISTVGLNQSIINSITLCKYNSGEGLVEGTECSVCLNDFQEDESLRLLPKCNHAFHPPCIDTWLKSHTNCPLCRAPIISNPADPLSTEPNFTSSGSGEESLVGNSENNGGFEIDDVREDGVSDSRVGTENLGELRVKDVPSPLANRELQVFDNMRDNHPVVEPGRRSVSLDSSSASMICLALANFLPVEPGGSSSSQLVLGSKSKFEIVPKRGCGNPSIYKLMGGSSFGRYLQKGPVSMKRSLSCSGKFLLPRNSGSRKSVIPL